MQLESELADARSRLDVQLGELNDSKTKSMELEERLRQLTSSNDQLGQQMVGYLIFFECLTSEYLIVNNI